MINDVKTFYSSGSVYAAGEQEIIVKNFNYDGTAPKTFFTVGRHGDPEDPDVQRFIITEEGFEDNVVSPRFPVLGAAENQTLRLSLKGSDLTVSDLKWISVWCFDFKVNFGDLEFELEPENLVFLGDLRTIQHDVSGEVYASGEEEIIIKSKDSILYDEGVPWSKKGDSNFDIGQGSYALFP